MKAIPSLILAYFHRTLAEMMTTGTGQCSDVKVRQLLIFLKKLWCWGNSFERQPNPLFKQIMCNYQVNMIYIVPSQKLDRLLSSERASPKGTSGMSTDHPGPWQKKHSCEKSYDSLLL